MPFGSPLTYISSRPRYFCPIIHSKKQRVLEDPHASSGVSFVVATERFAVPKSVCGNSGDALPARSAVRCFPLCFPMFFCRGSGRLRGAHRGASGQPGAPSTREGKTAEAGAARGESVGFLRPGVEKSRKSKGQNIVQKCTIYVLGFPGF